MPISEQLKAKVDICILSGGQSKRMGRDKGGLLIQSQTMLERIFGIACEVGTNVRVISHDSCDKHGPLSGVVTAWKSSKAEAILFLACDMPLITPELLEKVIRHFSDSHSPVFTLCDGRAGFPFLLTKRCSETARKNFDSANYSLQALAQSLQPLYFKPRKELLNINTPHEWQKARALLRSDKPAIARALGLGLRRNNIPILTDVNWRIRQGEHWAILGANGSGKTSLLGAMTGYITPSVGAIQVLGRIFGRSDWRELRRHIGVVSSMVRQLIPNEEPALHTVVSGRYGQIDLWKKPTRADLLEAGRLLRKLDCNYLQKRVWQVLSQGERQRVLIARALMAKPLLLILDEPCAGLDPVARETFLLSMQKLGRSRNSPGMILVTHHVEEIMPFITHVLLLREGRVVAQGPKHEVLQPMLLSKTFGCKVKLKKTEGRYFMTIKP